jgi:tetratricopeptide (TPR) repeat protein
VSRAAGRFHWHQAALRTSIFLLLYLFLVPLAGDSSGRPTSEKEAQLDRAHRLITQDEENEENMREAIRILETKRSQFPGDIRIPLYLAEAYYRAGDASQDSGKSSKTFADFEKAGSYAQQALEMDPGRPEAKYWYGLFLLRKAEHGSWLQAFGLTREGIRSLEEVRASLPEYEHAGASRILGELYYTAPGWSPFGDLDKSVRLEQEAVRLAPDYLLNRLCLARAYQKRGDGPAAIVEYRRIVAASPSARAGAASARYREDARKALVGLGERVDE